jgi:hypothetical protein
VKDVTSDLCCAESLKEELLRHRRSLAIKGLPVTYDYSVTAGCTQPLNGRSRVRERVASPGAVINLSCVDSKTRELLSLRWLIITFCAFCYFAKWKKRLFS